MIIQVLAFLSVSVGATDIKIVPPLAEPVSASGPVLNQLRLDLAALQAPGLASLTLSVPASVASLQKSLDAGARMSAPDAQTDALRRVEIARDLLARVEPGEFAKLPAAEQDAKLAGLWSGWKDRGLVDGGGAAPGEAFDRMIAAGVEDRALTSANKSVFLGAGVLGYPLADSLWIQRTRIGDALDENNLRYPSHQRWLADGRTPEFLGTTKEAQALVDDWGHATDYAGRIIASVRTGTFKPQASGAVSKQAAAVFGDLARELLVHQDEEALAYLSGLDPTFTAFLLDARKPGYYVYNGDVGVIGRVLALKSAGALGLRRLDKREGNVVASTYLYRPGRVAARLVEIGAQKVEAYDEDSRRRLLEYGKRLKALARGLSPR